MKILDATCGPKGIWYQKNHPFVTFMDKRNETVISNHKEQKPRRYVINPDVISEWKDTPFPDNHFDMVIFDPPHLILDRGKKPPNMVQEYGFFYRDNYRAILQTGIKKLFNILKPEGIFIFKWCENSITIEEVLKFFPYPPLFGSNIKKKTTDTYWIVFLKYRQDKTLDGMC